ncbi:hypothetical protein WDW86_01130 [Bdellovibrionota bacterium FG-2]
MKYFDLINSNDPSNYGNELCYNKDHTTRKWCALSKEGMQALNKLFPDMKGERFWTKSIEFDNWSIADFFDSRGGYLDYDDHTRGAKFAVRCVAK